MKKVSKKQKLIIELIIIIIVIFGFKPFLQQIEMWRSDDYVTEISKSPTDIERIPLFIEDNTNRTNLENQSNYGVGIIDLNKAELKCLTEDSLKICGDSLNGIHLLNTHNDQQLFVNFIKNSHDGEKISFSDFNSDNIDDAYYSEGGCGSTYCSKQYVVYSTNNSRLLWVIAKNTDWGEGQTEPDIKFIKTKDKARMIVVYDPGNSPQPTKGKQKKITRSLKRKEVNIYKLNPLGLTGEFIGKMFQSLK